MMTVMCEAVASSNASLNALGSDLYLCRVLSHDSHFRNRLSMLNLQFPGKSLKFCEKTLSLVEVTKKSLNVSLMDVRDIKLVIKVFLKNILLITLVCGEIFVSNVTF